MHPPEQIPETAEIVGAIGMFERGEIEERGEITWSVIHGMIHGRIFVVNYYSFHVFTTSFTLTGKKKEHSRFRNVSFTSKQA
jgi:hypothetical protein